MKQKVKQLITNPLIAGSAVLFTGSLLVSVLNFLFTLFMLRNLTVANYGVLASLLTLTSYFSIIAGSFMPSVIRYTAHYLALERVDLVKELYVQASKLMWISGVIVLLAFFIFSQQIGQFFHINNITLIFLAGVTVFIGFIGGVNGAVLQARLSFTFLTGGNLLAGIVKLLLGVAFVFLGFSVTGALGAIIISLFIQYLYTFIPLGFLVKYTSAKAQLHTRDIFTYGLSSAISLFCVTAFISNDVLLVKHFFNPVAAGMYAGLSLVGKVIFFFSSPIATAMFPIIVRKHTRNDDYHRTFLLSLLLVLLPSLALTMFYFIFPTFTILFFSKRVEYLAVAPLLGLYGIYITAYSLLSVIINFFLSIKELRVVFPLVLASVLQIVLIWFYHNDFLQVILISLFTVSLLLALLLLYYLYLYANRKKN